MKTNRRPEGRWSFERVSVDELGVEAVPLPLDWSLLLSALEEEEEPVMSGVDTVLFSIMLDDEGFASLIPPGSICRKASKIPGLVEEEVFVVAFGLYLTSTSMSRFWRVASLRNNERPTTNSKRPV